MSSNYILRILSSLLFCFALPSAYADFYLGGAAGTSSFAYDDVDDGSAKKLYIGYRMPSSNFALEASTLDSGDADVDGTSLFLTVDGFNFSGVFNTATNFGKSEPFNLFAKAGFYSTDTDLSDSFSSISESSNGISFGVGFEYALSDLFSVRMDIEGLIGVADFASDDDVTFITFGAQLNF